MGIIGVNNIPEELYPNISEYKNTQRTNHYFTDMLEGAYNEAYYKRASKITSADNVNKTNDISNVNQTAGANDIQGFDNYFPGYHVITKVGNCDISSANWQRNDFPYWNYFRENTSADCNNDWKPKGANPSQMEGWLQRQMGTVASGQVSILIPDELQKKMDADPAYAEEIYKKVAKWKEDYDRRDNALAASYGMDVFEHQASKSYVMQLDENGDVKNATVCGGGRITGPSEEELREIEAEQKKKRAKRLQYTEQLQENAMERADIIKMMQLYYYKSIFSNSLGGFGSLGSFDGFGSFGSYGAGFLNSSGRFGLF
ncbi:MAG: DUF6033 family protein [Clostridium sp.]|nr:DUF6033 family protein [Clostridium sp.]